MTTTTHLTDTDLLAAVDKAWAIQQRRHDEGKRLQFGVTAEQVARHTSLNGAQVGRRLTELFHRGRLARERDARLGDSGLYVYMPQ